ncbi:hypothetical protein BGZ83_010656 [Gryganskiella cystojenkinii]|nr:hypothetical protein BGZ83_010656 [Gryganskiella cystojenkinii]
MITTGPEAIDLAIVLGPKNHPHVPRGIMDTIVVDAPQSGSVLNYATSHFYGEVAIHWHPAALATTRTAAAANPAPSTTITTMSFTDSSSGLTNLLAADNPAPALVTAPATKSSANTTPGAPMFKNATSAIGSTVTAPPNLPNLPSASTVTAPSQTSVVTPSISTLPNKSTPSTPSISTSLGATIAGASSIAATLLITTSFAPVTFNSVTGTAQILDVNLLAPEWSNPHPPASSPSQNQFVPRKRKVSDTPMESTEDDEPGGLFIYWRNSFLAYIGIITARFL